MIENCSTFLNGYFLFQLFAFKVSVNLGVSNLNQVTFRYVVFHKVQFELPYYLHVERGFTTHRIYVQPQRIPGNAAIISGWFCAWEKKIRGSNTM